MQVSIDNKKTRIFPKKVNRESTENINLNDLNQKLEDKDDEEENIINRSKIPDP